MLGMGIAGWAFFVCWRPLGMEIEVWIFHHQDIRRRRRAPLINSDQTHLCFYFSPYFKMNLLPFQKLLSSLSRLFKVLANMGSISHQVYLLDRDEAETKRYVFTLLHYAMSLKSFPILNTQITVGKYKYP